MFRTEWEQSNGRMEMRIGKLATVKGDSTDMKWTEELKTTDRLMEIKNMAIKRMKEVYPYHIQNDGKTCFHLPDGLFMQFWTSRGKTEYDNALGMEYGNRPDLLPDDGDLYYPVDYDSFDELFIDILSETQRVENDF